jgi:hypothetical protein
MCHSIRPELTLIKQSVTWRRIKINAYIGKGKEREREREERETKTMEILDYLRVSCGIIYG